MPEQDIEKPAPTPAPAPNPAQSPSPSTAPVTSPAPTPEKPPFDDPFASVSVSKSVAPAPAADSKTSVSDKGGKPMAGKKDGIAEQRARIEQQNSLLAEREKDIQQMRSEIETLKKQGGGDVSALTSTIEQQNHQIQKLQNELGSRDYTKHPDYQSKYEKPFYDAAENARNIIESLVVTDTEGNERAAQWQSDFATLYSLPRAAARKLAKQQFGDDSSSVMQQYDELHRLDSTRAKALSDWSKNATEREKSERASQLANRHKVSQAFELVTKKLEESDPMFAIKPDNVEENELLKKSTGIVNEAFFNRDSKTLPELVVLDAAVRRRAISEPILRHRLSAALSELDDLRAKIAGRNGSKSGDVRRNAPPAGETQDNEDFVAQARRELNAA